MDRNFDVVIVGGGIGGGALAVRLARGGIRTLVLEREAAYRDRIRGEVTAPWGAGEAIALDLAGLLLDAGGGWSTSLALYDEMSPDPMLEDPTTAVPGQPVPGMLNVGHPDACEALVSGAAAAGATVVRGVREVEVSLGAAPSVSYRGAEGRVEVSCRLVVGADGRQSAVRKALGATLHESPARTAGAGMLVEGLEGWPGLDSIHGTDGTVYYLVLPRPGARARAYLFFTPGARPDLSGADRAAAFLRVFADEIRTNPLAKLVGDGRIAGPCAVYPSLETWVSEPHGDGAVLIGDAAGWTDPIIGQGLSHAYRDARLVSEVILGGTDWASSAFAEYGAERLERMRRTRVSSHLVQSMQADFSGGRHRRRAAFLEAVMGGDELAYLPFAAVLAGGHNLPAEAFTTQNVERVLAFGAA